MKMSAVF